MSLKQVSLDPFLLSGLYKTSLVPLVPVQKTVAGNAGHEVTFLGNNSRHITILIYNKDQIWLPDALFTFLTRILQACELSMDDVALVNRAAWPEISLSELLKQLTPERMILFGSFFREWLEIPLEKNKVQQVENIPALYSEELERLQTDKQLKKEFWKVLQEFFEIKKQS